MITGVLKKIVVGQNILDNEALWHEMFKGFTPYIPQEDFVKAISIVDSALWVARAEYFNIPLWRLLGGANPSVPVIGIGGYYERARDPQGIEKECKEFQKAGLAGIKFKVGALSIEEDAERVLALREIAGENFRIVVDSNMAWTPSDALRFAELIKAVRPDWLEEPVHRKNVCNGLRDVRLKSGIAIGAGQSDPSVFDSFRLLTSGAVDVLNMTYNRGGGITAWRKLASAADLADVCMAQVGEPHISMHLIGSTSNGTYAEIYPEPERDPFWHELYPRKPEIQNGQISLPLTAGLGFSIDLDRAEKFAVEDWA
jgi:L-alanine-DL-glutamate epimerase-like enolase superfamily enzyme